MKNPQLKNNLTTDDVFSEAKKLGKSVVKVASIPELGIENPVDFLNKMLSLRILAKKAYTNECYIEYISLMMLELEVWLRIYLYGKKQYTYKKRIKWKIWIL